MPNFIPDRGDWIVAKIDGKDETILKKSAFDGFNENILGLGDLKKRSVPTSALAAVFDLEGFTNFCKQIEPHLAVPNYLGRFVPWLLAKIREETITKEHPEGIELWHPLPFFTKFMGDGVLLLWNTETMGNIELENVIVSLHLICEKYEKELLTTLRKAVVDPPPRLRCGVARGTVFSVGDGADYVGSCINMAARVQKLPGVRFAFNRRGFDLERKDASEYITERFEVRKVHIRGIGEGELVAVLTADLNRMNADDKKIYRAP